MAVDWYFLKSTFFNRAKKMGPINDTDLLKKIEAGEINPDTKLSSDSKTKGDWILMRDIQTAYRHWKLCNPDVTDQK